MGRRALNSYPEHSTPPRPILSSMMNECEFGGQATIPLLLREGVSSFTPALVHTGWAGSTARCKFSCPPIQHLRPPTHLIKPHKPVRYKTGARSRTTGTRSRTTGARSMTTSARSRTTGARSRTSGARSETTGARSRTTYERSPATCANHHPPTRRS